MSAELVPIKAGRKVVAQADLDQRCVVIPVDGDWDGVIAPAVERAQEKGSLGAVKVLVIRDGQPLLLNGWSRVVAEETTINTKPEG